MLKYIFLYEGNNAPSTDNMKPSVEENLISEPTSGEVQLNNSKTSGQSDNVNSSDDRLENQNDSPDLPAPEKLLSVPETSAGPNNFLVESTPNKEVPDGVDGDGAGMTQISGRKRSLTESTLTVQSLNSVESFEVNGLKRTAESIPEDEDLLSSILGSFCYWAIGCMLLLEFHFCFEIDNNSEC